MTIDVLRQLCLSLPYATEDIKYGTDLCFSIGKKIFCGTRIEGAFRTGIKCTEENFAELIERDGIVPMPRLSVAFWIRIEKATALSNKEWERCIKKSHQLILGSLSKKEKLQSGIK
ncbi:MAG TPA: MmcQ/YjbR family DNA-binding protein [Chitinophagaceae bacterium]|jgi:predicted DNA-binding protein (MmcQ/YjbR family)|nr:MmcQ/YjbR family DNA-binding protein [Chitinophagaceae bacterium]